MTQKQFYTLVAAFWLIGSAWMLLSGGGNPVLRCTLKQLTGVPCPSCGTTRAVKLAFQGEWQAAFYMNPIGIVVAIGLVLLPVVLLWDVITRRMDLYQLFQRAHRWPLKALAVTGIALLLLNWIWNMAKAV